MLRKSNLNFWKVVSILEVLAAWSCRAFIIFFSISQGKKFILSPKFEYWQTLCKSVPMIFILLLLFLAIKGKIPINCTEAHVPCAQPYHPGSGSHGQLFSPLLGSSEWHSLRFNERGAVNWYYGGKVTISNTQLIIIWACDINWNLHKGCENWHLECQYSNSRSRLIYLRSFYKFYAPVFNNRATQRSVMLK